MRSPRSVWPGTSRIKRDRGKQISNAGRRSSRMCETFSLDNNLAWKVLWARSVRRNCHRVSPRFPLAHGPTNRCERRCSTVNASAQGRPSPQAGKPLRVGNCCLLSVCPNGRYRAPNPARRRTATGRKEPTALAHSSRSTGEQWRGIQTPRTAVWKPSSLSRAPGDVRFTHKRAVDVACISSPGRAPTNSFAMLGRGLGRCQQSSDCRSPVFSRRRQVSTRQRTYRTSPAPSEGAELSSSGATGGQ